MFLHIVDLKHGVGSTVASQCNKNPSSLMEVAFPGTLPQPLPRDFLVSWSCKVLLSFMHCRNSEPYSVLTALWLIGALSSYLIYSRDDCLPCFVWSTIVIFLHCLPLTLIGIACLLWLCQLSINFMHMDPYSGPESHMSHTGFWFNPELWVLSMWVLIVHVGFFQVLLFPFPKQKHASR